jgi:sugar fermentation stimulation protein A
LIRRYKRFLADVELPDGIETVHCPNPGAMTGMAEPGSAVLISESASRQRKLPLTWELVRVGRTWVCVNSQIANRVVGSWLRSGWLFPGAGAVESEVRVGSCRFDFRIGGRILVEVKTVTLRDGRFGAFPDSVTKRGTKHVESLAALKGGRRVLLFFVGRGDVSGVRLAEEIDPVYAAATRAAARSGVEILAVRAHFGPRGVRRGPQLDVSL